MRRAGKLGLGSAYLAGFRYALEHGYELVLTMDCDGTHHPRYLPQMLAAAEHADLVIGSRYVPGGGVVNWPQAPPPALALRESLHAHAAARAGARLHRRLPLLPPQRARDGGSLRVRGSGYSFLEEMVYRVHHCGFRIAEVPILFEQRTHGVSKIDEREIYRAAWHVLVTAVRRPDPARAAPALAAAQIALRSASSTTGLPSARRWKRSKARSSASSRQREAQRLHARDEARAPGQLAEHDLRAARVTDARRVEHLVVLAPLEHAVLVDARRVAERVGADHRLVAAARARRCAPRPAPTARRCRAGRRRCARPAAAPCTSIAITTSSNDGVAGALADAVHRQLDLARARRRSRPARSPWRGRDRPGRGTRAPPPPAPARARAARGISAATCSGSAQPTVSGMLIVRAPAASAARTTSTRKSGDGARRVHRRELDVVRGVARARRPRSSTISSTSSRPLRSWWASCTSEALMKVWMRGALGAAQRRRRGVDVEGHRARERAHRACRAPRAPPPATAARSAAEAAGKPASTTSTRMRRERARDLHLVLRREADARGLLAVAQRGIEHDDSVGHDLAPWWSPAPGTAGAGPRLRRGHEVPRNTKPSPAGSAGEGWVASTTGLPGARQPPPAPLRSRPARRLEEQARCVMEGILFTRRAATSVKPRGSLRGRDSAHRPAPRCASTSS